MFPRLKIKIKGHHFDTIEVTEAESLLALNTFTERDFYYAFKNGRRTGNGANERKETISRMMVGSRPKINF
jgi:hypothetical protein